MKLAIGLGIGTAVAALFAIPPALPWHLIGLSGPGYLVVFALAAAAITGGWQGNRSFVLIAGAGLLAAAVFQLFELAIGGQNTLGGDLSTVSLFLGFGTAFLSIGLIRPDTKAQS